MNIIIDFCLFLIALSKDKVCCLAIDSAEIIVMIPLLAAIWANVFRPREKSIGTDCILFLSRNCGNLVE